MHPQPAKPAPKPVEPARTTAKRKGILPYMSERQVQAYLAAREALRRARQAA